jgi:hypothetical protein
MHYENEYGKKIHIGTGKIIPEFSPCVSGGRCMNVIPRGSVDAVPKQTN